jgi:adenylate kinase
MIVFVAGLSRSGKTSRSQHAAATLRDIDYVSVSSLLRDAGRTLSVATIGEALENQRWATDAFRAASFRGRHVLIDGHALIETGEGPMLVPDWFFEELRPDVLMFVRDHAEAISSRRSGEASERQTAEIAALGMMEEGACERVASRLQIPLVTLTAPSLEDFADALRQRLEY